MPNQFPVLEKPHIQSLTPQSHLLDHEYRAASVHKRINDYNVAVRHLWGDEKFHEHKMIVVLILILPDLTPPQVLMSLSNLSIPGPRMCYKMNCFHWWESVNSIGQEQLHKSVDLQNLPQLLIPEPLLQVCSLLHVQEIYSGISENYSFRFLLNSHLLLHSHFQSASSTWLLV